MTYIATIYINGRPMVKFEGNSAADAFQRAAAALDDFPNVDNPDIRVERVRGVGE